MSTAPIHYGKPYICATCDEHRDAHESPPSANADGELVCESCPEPTIPASRIMRERDEHRQAWAREYTRANLLDASLERARRDTDEWRRIALENGELLAQERVANARLCKAISDMRYRGDRSVSLSRRHAVGTPAESGGQYRLVRYAEDGFRLEGTEWSATGSGSQSIHQSFGLAAAREFAATCIPPVDVDAMEVSR